MKKGFTLAELLGVIVILGIIALIITPVVTNTINESEEKAYKKQVKVIEQAAMEWGLENVDKLPDSETDEKTVIYINNLVSLGKLQNSSVIDPRTNEQIQGCVVVTYNSEYNQHEYTFNQGDSCLVSLTTYIEKLYSPKEDSLKVDGITYQIDTTNGLMDDRLGGTVSSEGNIRYYGANPNNYIDIGDRDSSGNVILWRIIGVFKDIEVVKDDGTTEKQNLVKIIRNDSIGTYSWDNKTNGIGSSLSGYGSNVWSDSRLMMLLNPGYEKPLDTNIYAYEGSLYWNKKSGTCYSKNNNATLSCNFTSSGLSLKAKEKIEKVVWNLGGWNTYENVYSNDWYKYERENRRNNNNYSEKWPGKVGLMYPSDYGYAVDLTQCNQDLDASFKVEACIKNNWLFNNGYQWTITPVSNSQYYVYNVDPDGNLNRNTARATIRWIRPTVYLKSDISITGEGTTSDGISYYVIG